MQPIRMHFDIKDKSHTATTTNPLLPTGRRLRHHQVYQSVNDLKQKMKHGPNTIPKFTISLCIPNMHQALLAAHSLTHINLGR